MSGQSPPRPQSHQPRRPDASMTLLNEVLNSPIDPGYSVAQGRKERLSAAGQIERPGINAKIIALGVAILLGFFTVSAVTSMRSRVDLSNTTRAVLISEITERKERLDVLEVDHEETLIRVDALHAETLTNSDPVLGLMLAADELTNGAVAVHGPGLRITLTDGVGSDEDEERRVQDTDVRSVVNALWSSGAEAVAINGKRLTATSAIRAAGAAILVDLTGLSGPYVIEAIADPDQLSAQFARTLAASQLEVLKSAYGIESQVQTVQELELPAGVPRSLRLAVPIEQP